MYLRVFLYLRHCYLQQLLYSCFVWKDSRYCRTGQDFQCDYSCKTKLEDRLKKQKLYEKLPYLEK